MYNFIICFQFINSKLISKNYFIFYVLVITFFFQPPFIPSAELTNL